jgi:hypothetical protein
MSDQFDPTQLPEEQPSPSFGDAFAQMEESLTGVPENVAFITLRSGSGNPVYVGLLEGETGLVLREAIDRAGLTIGGVVQFYVDQNPVTLDSVIPADAVVTMLGNVKGG